MRKPEQYEIDILFFFDGRPAELALYEALLRRMETEFPEGSVKVQKSQISFCGRHLFAMVSLPRRKRDSGIIVTLGLSRRLESPRVSASAEPYPGRWTHHVVLTCPGDVEGEVSAFLAEAYWFARTKGRRK